MLKPCLWSHGMWAISDLSARSTGVLTDLPRCTQLAHSIYHLKPSVSASRYGSPVAKVAAILVPILQVSLMRASVVQNDPVAFYFLANFISMLRGSPRLSRAEY